MLSSRGAISTNVAMVECAGGQTATPRKEVFLLSELEKVWVSLAIVTRRLLLEGKNVCIPHFLSFWVEDQVLLTDAQRRRYMTRKLCFGLNASFALRYGVDSVKVPLEKASQGFSKVAMADIVAVCEVPARTASMALKEFFLYIGEGMYQGRVFNLSLPGVATLVMKRERAVLTADWELTKDMFEIDARRWPVEMREAGLVVLEAGARPGSARGSECTRSRPVSQVSRRSWLGSGSSTGPAPAPAFTAAAPAGRLFSEIEEEQRRRTAHRRDRAMREVTAQQRDQRQERVERDILRFNADSDGEGEADAEQDVDYDKNEADHLHGWTRRGPCPTTTAVSGESVYNLVPPPPRAETTSVEPEIEAVEEVAPDDIIPTVLAPHDAPAGQASSFGRPLYRKDVELEAVLRAEEPFSRPITRRSYHEHSSVRDLIYAVEQPQTEKPVNRVGTLAAPSVETPRFGRKRFDGADTALADHVAALLKSKDPN